VARLRLIVLAIVPPAIAQLLSLPALSQGLGQSGMTSFLALTALAPWLGLAAFGYDQRARSCVDVESASSLARFGFPVGITCVIVATLAAVPFMHWLYPGWTHRTAALAYFLGAAGAGVLAGGREASYARGDVAGPVAAHALACIAGLLGIWCAAALVWPMAAYVVAWTAPFLIAWGWCCRRSGYVPTRRATLQNVLADSVLSVPYAAQMAGFVALLSFDVLAFVPGRGTAGTAYVLYSKFALIGGTIGMTILAQFVGRVAAPDVSRDRITAIAVRLILSWMLVATAVAVVALTVGEFVFMHFAHTGPLGFGWMEAGGLLLLIVARGMAETWAMIAAVRKTPRTARRMSLVSFAGVVLMFIVGRTSAPTLAGMFGMAAVAWLVPATAGLLGHLQPQKDSLFANR
jgi:hypothetical protein